MAWKKLPIVAFDTETTGLQAHNGDRVIEFAAVEFTLDEAGQIENVHRREKLFNPGIPIPREVVKLTGIADEDVVDAPEFKKHAKDIWSLLDNRIIVAHNLPFDRGFLCMEFRKLGLDWPSPLAEIDTYDLSVRFFKETRGHKLSDAAGRLNVVLDGAHRASNDAEASGRVFLEIARRMNAPETLHEMLEWADALGRPPENDVIVLSETGVPVFAEGPLTGHPIEDHPVHLQWMEIALTRKDGQWHPRFSEALRSWISCFLRIRASGRARQNPKSFSPADWTIDSLTLPPDEAGLV